MEVYDHKLTCIHVIRLFLQRLVEHQFAIKFHLGPRLGNGVRLERPT
jgi:hypothetical protein